MRLPLAVPLVLAACQSGGKTAPPPPSRVLIASGAAPAFAADPDAILSELEHWRGRAFLGDLEVELVPRSAVANERLNGWYEPDTRRLVVVEGESDAMGRGVLVHELFHALQDQHFGLARLHEQAKDSDAERAVTALIEGEAMLAVAEIIPYDFEQHAKLPPHGPLDAVRFEKIFHYGAGLRFVRALREQGGWELVDQAFRDPPRRTAEILHPDRYLARTRERDEEELFTAWRLTDFEVGEYEPLGEYDLQLFLARSEELRPRAAELAATLIAGRSLRDASGEAPLWITLLSDAEAARAMLAAAEQAGAAEAKALPPDPRLICFRPRPAL